jgi:broad specificity phosphatase PhoE
MASAKQVARYVSHPQVKINPVVPVTEWGLSLPGRVRAEAWANAGWLYGTTRIISSVEQKAIETAEILARSLGLTVDIREAMHENDRSSTGFLPPEEFEAVASQFFANPEQSIRGWERSIDAQARIVREVEAVLAQETTGDTLFVGHGGVGTLLYCHYAEVAIDRAFDQPPGGGGNYLTLTLPDRDMPHSWRPMEFPPDTIFASDQAIA